MNTDNYVDGNALGGLLHDLFGREVTHQLGCCDRCGAVRPVASLLVYRGPGAVLRCPRCGTVLIVAVSSPAGTRLGFGALRWLEFRAPPDRHPAVRD
jgi:hypothetical protein